MSDIAISAGTRRQLLSLQRATELVDRTQERLASGLKVNSAIDDALAFFKARNLNARASDLSSIKDDIVNGISVLRATVQGLETIESVLKQMKALAQSAVSSPESTTRAKLASQFNELRSQVDNIMEDSSYSGVNLLKNTTTPFTVGADNMTVKFNERTDAKAVNQLIVSGISTTDFTSIMARSAVATGTAGDTTVWGQTGTAAITAINSSIRAIDSALVTVRQTAQTFGTNSSMLELRRQFTENIINTLKGGAASLVNADLNEESANLLSLQTRQQLGIIAIGLRGGSLTSLLERLL